MLKGKSGEDVAEILCRKHEVPGTADPLFVITHDECYGLLPFLPRKYTKNILKFQGTQFARLRGGDPSLHAEIDRQWASNGLEARMARSAVGLPEVPVAAVVDEEERSLKRRRMRAEVEMLEVEVTKAHADAARACIDAAWKAKEVITELFGGNAMDDRDQLMMRDHLRSLVYGRGGVKLLENGEVAPGERREITIDEITIKIGRKPDSKLRPRIGKEVAAEYRRRYGEEPKKCWRYVDGAQREVNCYEKKEEGWMTDVVRKFYEARGL